jgi:Tol biopolymer transport system component
MNRRLAALATAATLTTLTVAAPVRAVALGRHSGVHSSRIVWTQVLDGKFSTARIVSARPDGSGLRALTHPGAKRFDIGAVVSPDGSRVLFERDLPSGRSVLKMVGADGRGAHVIPVRCVKPCAGVEVPSWAPGGRHITFTRVIGPFDRVNHSARSAVLYIARPDGSRMRRLSPRGIDGAYEDYHSRFDASGKHLVFIRVRNRDVKSAVFRMRADGSDVQQLTPWRLDADEPDLSLATQGATKDLVVFETFGHGPPKGSQQDIATVPATCHPLAACIREMRYVTHNGAGPHTSFNPSWSPDGQRIAFTNALFPKGKPAVGNIWTVRPNGRDRQQVSRSPRFEFRPDWGR